METPGLLSSTHPLSTRTPLTVPSVPLARTRNISVQARGCAGESLEITQIQLLLFPGKSADGRDTGELLFGAIPSDAADCLTQPGQAGSLEQ